MSDDHAWNHIRIGERGIEELERAMTQALAPLLGGHLQIQITKIVRSDDAVTALEIEAELEPEEEETAFAIG